MFWPTSLLDLGLLCIFLVVLGRCLRARQTSTARFAPGPPPLPLVGNLRDMATDESPWLTFTRWAREYGDLVYFNVLGQHAMVVSSVKVANDLFERRSRIYSDRVQFPMVDLMGWDFNLSFMPYGDRWRRNRRVMRQQLQPVHLNCYKQTTLKKVNQALLSILESPDAYSAHITSFVASTIMLIVYGYEVSSENDRLVKTAEQSLAMLKRSMFTGATLMNMIPSLQRLPEWLPGMGFKRFAKRCYELTERMKNVPLKHVKEQMRENANVSCMASRLMEKMKSLADGTGDESLIEGVCATIYGAGSDTTNATLHTAILAIMLHPEAQKKAQAEIDAVTGGLRLPDFGDRPHLSYVEALYWEILRWRPATPIAGGHASTENDIYDGYMIPKGTNVLVNAWAMLHDENTYPHPGLFLPERFLTERGALLDQFPTPAFGFGRRVCPGRSLADVMVWAMLVSILAVFDVRPPEDFNDAEVRYTRDIIIRPLPFKCKLRARSDRAEKIIRTGPNLA